MFLTTIQRSS